MKSKMIVLILALILALPLLSYAQSGGGYELTWSTTGSGGSSSGGSYALAGSIGQPDAGALSGAGYTLAGGFWVGGSNGYRVYLPLFVK